jgi:hypothetical protein
MIVITVLLCFSNSWGVEVFVPDRESISKQFDSLNSLRKKKSVYEDEGKTKAKQQEVNHWEKEALEKLKEAPERCICSDLGIQRLYGKATRAAVLNCKCGEAQCVVNLEGGISCLKQGLFK